MKLSVDNIVLVGSVLLLVSIFAGKTSYRIGVPILILFLGVGMLFGSDGFGLEFSNPKAAQFIGVIALNIILFSGGMDTKFSEVRPVVTQGIALATVGVFLTAGITGFFIFWLTNHFFESITFSLLSSLLLGSVMSSTDSASVFAILNAKGLNLKHQLRPLLEFESGSNDPMAYLLTITLIPLIQLEQQHLPTNVMGNLGSILGSFAMQLVIGALLGYVLGRLAVRLINRINLDNQALYPVLLLSIVFIIFSVTNDLSGNGYLAVYIGGLVVGNAKFIHKRSTKSFFDGMAWLFQIVMFLTLGLLVNPSDLLPVIGVGLAISLFLIFGARPLAVWLCLLPFTKMPVKAKHYISWVGLRGAVPIIFATYAWTEGLTNARMIFNIVFFATLVSLLVQGTTVSYVARFLGLEDESVTPSKLSEFDMELPEDVKSTMSEITVREEHLTKGERVMDLPMPKNTLIVMVKRNGHYFVPTGSTELEPQDILLLISDNKHSLEDVYAKMGVKA